MATWNYLKKDSLPNVESLAAEIADLKLPPWCIKPITLDLKSACAYAGKVVQRAQLRVLGYFYYDMDFPLVNWPNGYWTVSPNCASTDDVCSFLNNELTIKQAALAQILVVAGIVGTKDMELDDVKIAGYEVYYPTRSFDE